jgi:hypothetical protein
MSDTTVREYERIIDHGYRSLAVFDLPFEDAAYGVLAAFDSHMVTERMVRVRAEKGSLSIAQVQLFKYMGEGFIQAMRWLLDGRESVNVRPSPRADLLEIGNELIDYGSRYFRASIMYSGYSQGKMDAVVTPETRRVRFVHKPDAVHKHATWAIAEEASCELLHKTPEWKKHVQRLQSRAAEVFRRVPHQLKDGRIVLGDVSVLCDERVRQGLEPGTSRRRIFTPDIDLGGFNIGEFDAFWRALYTWSVCVTDIYHYSCDRRDIPQEQCMPTQVVRRDQFLRSMVTLSGLPHATVESILTRLKVDHRTSKLDMYLQPLLCGSESVAWSVRAVQLSVSQRNLLKLMARTPSQKALADDIIGNRERSFLAELANWLTRKGWTVATNQELPGLEHGEVDLIGWNWTYPSEILIIEAKALLQADDPNEVRTATRAMKDAQGQLERIIRILSQLPESVREGRFPFVDWRKVTRWYGVVITPEGEPGLEYDHSTFPACSFASLQQRLSANECRSPSRLWSAMVGREWQAYIRAGRVEYAPFELAGITFEEPMIVE